MKGWLSGYRAIDLTDERGLLAGHMLAKLGMDVIQVEPPNGSTARLVSPFDEGGNSYYWSAYAAGKRGITLNLTSERGRELLLELVAHADFLFESANPGYYESLGLTREALVARNPSLIHVSITPFGSDGAKRDYADSELILWASGGPLYSNRGTSASRPLRITVPQAYLHGAADAAVGALIAHFARLKTGRGQHVDISVQQSVTQATLASHLSAAIGHENFLILSTTMSAGSNGSRTLDMSGSGSRTRRSKWQVRDGLVEMHLGLGPAGGGSANNMFAWMKSEGALPEKFHDWDWRTLPDRILDGEINEDDLEAARAAVANFLAPRTKAELQREAHARKIMLAPINTMTDLLHSPQLNDRQYFWRVSEGGISRVIPGAFAKSSANGMFAEPKGAPTLGQDNASVYCDLLGLDAASVDQLRTEGAI